MRFTETALAGVWVLELDRLQDERGFFARSFDAEEFAARGMNPAVVQCNISFNARRGTLRGMHYQADPHGESKLVRCVRGAVFDVALDLRDGSPTHVAWHGVELSEDNGRALYIPAGVAHGFQSLSEDSELLYLMGDLYVGDAARGVRWDDPAFAIDWPESDGPRIISERDRTYPDFSA